MGSIGPAEIFVVLIVALIVLGPNRLPDAARSVGKAMAELRRVTSGVQAEVRDAFAEPPTYPAPPPAATSTDAKTPAPRRLPDEPAAPGTTQDAPPAYLPPTSPEQAEVVVIREPDPPQSA